MLDIRAISSVGALEIPYMFQVDTKIRDNQEKYTLIYVPEPFIAPGGRFREFYYWDAYWIIKGLLASNMTVTARNMINNLASMVDR